MVSLPATGPRIGAAGWGSAPLSLTSRGGRRLALDDGHESRKSKATKKVEKRRNRASFGDGGIQNLSSRQRRTQPVMPLRRGQKSARAPDGLHRGAVPFVAAPPPEPAKLKFSPAVR